MGCGGAALLACRWRGEGGRVREVGAGELLCVAGCREGRRREGIGSAAGVCPYVMRLPGVAAAWDAVLCGDALEPVEWAFPAVP